MPLNSTPTPTQEISKLRKALPQILAVCAKNVLLLGFGMTLGYPTILIPSLSGNDGKEDIVLGPDAISWIGSINLIGVPIGCLLSGSITQPVGRKRAMQLVNIPFLCAWLLFHFSTEVWQVFLALCLTGLSGGLLEAPVLTYVAEVTEPHLRGILSATSTMAVITGIFLQFIFGTYLNWRIVALVNCIIPVGAFILLIFIPETPLWLIRKGRIDDGRKSLAWLRGWTQIEDIEDEFKLIHKQCTEKKKQHLTLTDYVKLFLKKNFYWPYCLCSFVFFISHFNGSSPLQTYAINIFTNLNAPISSYYATIIMGLAQWFGALICVIIIHVLGKRALNFISLAGTSACFIVVAIYAQIYKIDYLDLHTDGKTENAPEFNWVPVTFLVLAAFTANLGIKALPWILTGECFPDETRALASGYSAAIGYVFNFITNKIFLSLVSSITLPIIFHLYAFIGFGGIVILYFILPETEGKTLFDISEHFRGGPKLDNKIGKRRTELTGQQNVGFEMDDVIINNVNGKN